MRRLLSLLPAITGLIFGALGLSALFAPARLADSLALFPASTAGYGAVRGDLGAFFLLIAVLSFAGIPTARRRLLALPIALLTVVIAGRGLAQISNGSSPENLRAMAVESFALLMLVLARLWGADSPRLSRRVAVLVIGVIALLATGLTLARRTIGMSILRRNLDQNLSQPLIPSLADGLHAGLCGSGAPLADPLRAGPCVFVIAGRRLFIVDAGDGVARRMSLMRVPPGQIEAVFLTHFHSDHIGGLGELMLQRWTSVGRSQPLPVYGPEGVASVVEGFNAAYALDAGYRVAHHGADIVPPTGTGGKPVMFTMPDSAASTVILAQEGLTVTAFAVNHAPVSPAVGYRFDYKGRSVTVSGDTAPSPSLTRAANNTDVLFHEGLQTAMVDIMREQGELHKNRNLAKIAHDIPSYHTSPEDAARAAAQAHAGRLVFYHLVPPVPSAFFNAAFLGDAAKFFSGPITVGTDGLMLSLPAGSRAAQIRELL